jgi:hypothetical protein
LAEYLSVTENSCSALCAVMAKLKDELGALPGLVTVGSLLDLEVMTIIRLLTASYSEQSKSYSDY